MKVVTDISSSSFYFWLNNFNIGLRISGLLFLHFFQAESFIIDNTHWNNLKQDFKQDIICVSFMNESIGGPEMVTMIWFYTCLSFFNNSSLVWLYSKNWLISKRNRRFNYNKPFVQNDLNACKKSNFCFKMNQKRIERFCV